MCNIVCVAGGSTLIRCHNNITENDLCVCLFVSVNNQVDCIHGETRGWECSKHDSPKAPSPFPCCWMWLSWIFCKFQSDYTTIFPAGSCWTGWFPCTGGNYCFVFMRGTIYQFRRYQKSLPARFNVERKAAVLR